MGKEPPTSRIRAVPDFARRGEPFDDGMDCKPPAPEGEMETRLREARSEPLVKRSLADALAAGFELVVNFGHTNWIRSVAYSPDERDPGIGRLRQDGQALGRGERQDTADAERARK